MTGQETSFGRYGAFHCRDCGRRTRNTGRGNNGACGLCGHCYERIVTEEQMMNEGVSSDLVARRQSCIDACKRAGGTPNEDGWPR